MTLGIKVSIIYPVEPSYIIGLLDGLSKVPDLQIEFLGSDRSEIVRNKYSNIKFINIRGNQDPKSPLLEKILRILKFYVRLFIYCIKNDSKIYHSHFPNKFLLLDFVIINIILKLRGKKIVYTAHNIDYNLRDRKQSIYKTIIFNFLYRIADMIIVHNKHSARILLENYPVAKDKVSILRIGLNIAVTKTGLSKIEARKLLTIDQSSKVLLFFGGINQYKGLDTLLIAFSKLVNIDKSYLLLIAGLPRDDVYFEKIKSLVQELGINDFIRGYFQFIPDSDVEKFFIASDCCVLPYRAIFQSGVHVLCYSFGVPIIASDVGSFKEEDIIEGETGFIFKKNDYNDLFLAIQKFFNSHLFVESEEVRIKIINWAEKIYSWNKIGQSTFRIYKMVFLNK